MRIGLTSITQRGLKETEVKKIAKIMDVVATHYDNIEILDMCKLEANKLISKFPLYPEGYFFNIMINLRKLI